MRRKKLSLKPAVVDSDNSGIWTVILKLSFKTLYTEAIFSVVFNSNSLYCRKTQQIFENSRKMNKIRTPSTCFVNIFLDGLRNN